MRALPVLFIALFFAGGTSTPLGLGEVARLGDRVITLQAYKDFLYLGFGQSLLDDLMEVELLRLEADRLGLQPAPEEWERLLEGEMDKVLRERFLGDRELMATGLLEQGFTVAEKQHRIAFELERTLLQERIIRATRQPTEDQVRRKFEELHGLGGVRLEIRHIQISIGPLLQAALAKGQRIETIDRVELEAQALARAEEAHALLQAGRPFHEVCLAFTDDSRARAQAGNPATAHEAGRVEGYRFQRYGTDFAAAVRGLAEGGFSKPVAFRSAGNLVSYHVILLDQRAETDLETVREQVTSALLAEKPTFFDRKRLRQELLHSGRIVTRLTQHRSRPTED